MTRLRYDKGIMADKQNRKLFGKDRAMTAPFIYSFTEPVHPEDLQSLFQQTDWAQRRTPLDIQQMLDRSQLTLGVWDDDRLIGFARVVTDDLYRAWIEDIVVDRAYRKQGIASLILEKLLKRLQHIELVMLDCPPAWRPFYAKFGFEPKTAVAMQRTNSK